MNDTVTSRGLSRATLARQMLLRREKLDVVHAVERLVGMQAQLARAPFVGLWTRLEGFERKALQTALDEKRMVRATFLRGTLHLASTKDFVALRGTVQLALDAALTGVLRERVRDIDTKEVIAVARAFFREPHSFDDLRKAFGDDGDIRAKAFAARCLVPLVQLHDGSARFVLAESYLGKKIPTLVDAPEIVRRYLAAFGPATVADAQAWSGIPNLKSAFASLASELVTLRDEKKRELFDLKNAPRPPEDTPAPPRFLPEFDNVVLSHKDRKRFVGDAHRKAIYLPGLRVAPTFLAGGLVSGTWKVERAKTKAMLTATAFAKLPKNDREVLAAEAKALVRFIEPEASTFDVVISSAS